MGHEKKTENITLALIQTSCGDDRLRNMENTINLIRESAKKGGEVVCLQELFQSPYFCRTIERSWFSWAEKIPGPTTETLCELAKELEIVILAPLFEKQASGLYFNSMVTIDADGTLLGTYRKMHIPDDPGFYEKYYFAPGDSGYQVYQTRFGKIGTLICWDQWYPEAARITALKGADLIVYPTAIGTIEGEGDEEKKKFLDAWQIIQRSHAIANGCYIASINRVGKEADTSFWGHSFVTGPFGEIEAEAGESETILMAEIDVERIESQRQEWPFFRDRRIDSYSPVLKRWNDD